MNGLSDSYLEARFAENLGNRIEIRYRYTGGYGMDTWDEFGTEEGILQSYDKKEKVVLLRSRKGVVHFQYAGLNVVSILQLEDSNETSQNFRRAVVVNTKNVFISYGHNEVVLSRVERFLRDRLGLNPIVLANQPDEGLTVVEKLEKYATLCCYGIVIMTEDDKAESVRRARQNVIHEIGYLHGLIGRKRVLLLRQDNVELFSNISGVVYKSFSSEQVERTFDDIRKDLETLGILGHAH
ncbi:MAG: TIR domain-containing protein [Candidatus Tectimicrobiota bacterium]